MSEEKFDVAACMDVHPEVECGDISCHCCEHYKIKSLQAQLAEANKKVEAAERVAEACDHNIMEVRTRAAKAEAQLAEANKKLSSAIMCCEGPRTMGGNCTPCGHCQTCLQEKLDEANKKLVELRSDVGALQHDKAFAQREVKRITKELTYEMKLATSVKQKLDKAEARVKELEELTKSLFGERNIAMQNRLKLQAENERLKNLLEDKERA